MATTNNAALVIDAINASDLKVSYKMKQALLRLAKSSKAPLARVTFFIEPIEENRHGKGYADGAEVFYQYTASNHNTTVAFDGSKFGI